VNREEKKMLNFAKIQSIICQSHPSLLFPRRHDIQHNNTQQNDIQHKDIQYWYAECHYTECHL
jgi:hypothetical protein